MSLPPVLLVLEKDQCHHFPSNGALWRVVKMLGKAAKGLELPWSKFWGLAVVLQPSTRTRADPQRVVGLQKLLPQHLPPLEL